MIITTPLKYDERLVKEVKSLSEAYNIPFVHRNKDSVQSLLSQYDALLVVGKEKVQLITEKENFTYHPNFAQVRMKRILNGEADPFLEVTQLKPGDIFLDCTMGIGSDSLIASHITDSVTSLESVRSIYLAVVIGMKKYRYTLRQLECAAGSLSAINIDAYRYLKEQPSNSIDVIYFDPMYEKRVKSEGIETLKYYANKEELTDELIKEAKRVARKRIVLKAHYNSPMFKQFKFMQCIRKNTISHYGVIIIN